MAKKRRKNKSAKLQERKYRIKKKEIEIVNSGNEVDFSEENIEKVMKENGLTKYSIDASGDVRLDSNFDSWVIGADERVVFLYHANSKNVRGGNDRSSYHLHNVFYDLEYAAKTIKQHDEYEGAKYNITKV